MDTLQTDVNIMFGKAEPSLGLEGRFIAIEEAFERLHKHLSGNGHHNPELMLALSQRRQDRRNANAHSHWMNPDLSWLKGFKDWILSARDWLTSLGYAPSEEHAPMDGIQLRPDYRPGDSQFDADADILSRNMPLTAIFHDGKGGIQGLDVPVNRLYAAERQAVYWRQQAQTIAPKTAGKAKPSKPTYQGYAVNTATFGHGMFVQVVFEDVEADLDVRRERIYQDARGMAMRPAMVDVQQGNVNRYAVEFRIDGGADVARGILQRMLIEMEV